MLDARFQIAPALQQVFRNKDTGLPLSNGQVYFYEDKQRTVLKPVYELTGAPPNYTYTPLPNPLALNSVGAFETAVYYFPFAANGDIDLYFIEVLDALKPTGIVQLTREAYPNFIDAEVDLTTADPTFVPNPQFLFHNDLREIPSDPLREAGQVRAPVTDVAYGGWTFERPSASTARDFITFPRFGSFGTLPEGDPRYEIDIQCQLPDAGDIRKDLCLKFKNVNRFASLTNMLTYGFTARSNSGSNIDIDLLILKNFGTGGSATTESALTTFTFTPTYQQFFFSFVFGDNSATNIGLQDDDFIQLILRLPVDTLSNVSLTSFFLFDGALMAPTYPITTTSQMDYRSLAGFLKRPNFNNTDWYLPIRLTPNGLDFDTTQIGKIYLTSLTAPEFGELECNGNEFVAQAISSEGIPYSRLQAKWRITSAFPGNNYPLYGTGLQYITQWRTKGLSSQAFFYPNLANELLNGLANTTPFTFAAIEPTEVLDLEAFTTSPGNGVMVLSKINGVPAGPISAGTSGFTIDIFNSGVVNGVPGSSGTRIQFRVITLAAAGLAGLYFEFSNSSSKFYMWFTVDGAGADPVVVGSNAVKLALLSTDTSVDVANLVALRLRNLNTFRMTFTAANLIAGGNSFLFNTFGANFYVWYTVDAVGIDPNLLGRIALQVDVLSTDTADEVNEKTQIVVNDYSFRTPDLRGYFVRGLNTGNTPNAIDPDNDLRFNFGVTTDPDFDLPGRIEWDANRDHNHGMESGNVAGGTPLPQDGVFNFGQTLYTEFEGRPDSHPRNISFMYVVKY